MRQPPHVVHETPALDAPKSSSESSENDYSLLACPEVDTVIGHFYASLAARFTTCREHTHPSDRETVLRWLRAGAEHGINKSDMVALVLEAMRTVHPRLRHPPAGLRYHDGDVARSLAIRTTNFILPEHPTDVHYSPRRRTWTPAGGGNRRVHGTDPDLSKRAILRGLADELESDR
jgi:hypothetical protein